MHPEELLRENLALLQRTAERVCKRAGVGREEAEDLASELKITLMDNDYAVLRAWEGRASLATYVAVIAQRLFADRRIADHGRWHASAEAKRGGDAAVLIETLVRRRGCSLDEALPLVRELDPSMTRERVADIVERLPDRSPRWRPVSIEAAQLLPSTASEEQGAMVEENFRVAERASTVLREAIARLPTEDQTLIQLHYGSSVSIADIARMLHVPQRPLYRRAEALLRRFREAFQAARLDQGAIDDVIGSNTVELDFGFGGKNGPARQTSDKEVR